SVALAVAGCSTATSAAAGSTGSSPATVSASPVQAIPTTASPTAAASTLPVPTTAAPTAGGPATGATTTPSPGAGVATLGQSAGDFARGDGFGQVRPPEIFNGGDPTGLVTHVAWKSWGGGRAVATGTSDYVGPNQSVAQ